MLTNAPDRHVEQPNEAPPNRRYAARHAEAIRWHSSRGMKRETLETIYGATAVAQVLDGV